MKYYLKLSFLFVVEPMKEDIPYAEGNFIMQWSLLF